MGNYKSFYKLLCPINSTTTFCIIHSTLGKRNILSLYTRKLSSTLATIYSETVVCSQKTATSRLYNKAASPKILKFQVVNALKKIIKISDNGFKIYNGLTVQFTHLFSSDVYRPQRNGPTLSVLFY